MLHRKSELKKYYYFFKSIHGMWILPVVILNFLTPALNLLLHKLTPNGADADIQQLNFFFLPVFSVWVCVFITDMFFSNKTRDIFFFYNNKKRFIVSFVTFIIFLIDAFAVALLHFYCIDDFIGFALKIVFASVFYYGLSMLVLYLSKSAAITAMIILLYDLINTLMDFGFFPFYQNYDKLDFTVFLTTYLPLILSGFIFVLIVFVKKKHRVKA